jgi:hypothetical protein
MLVGVCISLEDDMVHIGSKIVISSFTTKVKRKNGGCLKP